MLIKIYSKRHTVEDIQRVFDNWERKPGDDSSTYIARILVPYETKGSKSNFGVKGTLRPVYEAHRAQIVMDCNPVMLILIPLFLAIFVTSMMFVTSSILASIVSFILVYGFSFYFFYHKIVEWGQFYLSELITKYQ